MSPAPSTFPWLTHEEFLQLSTEAKVAYLAEAVEVLNSERGSIFVGRPPRPQKPKPTLQ
jgi:hypothetical protein